MAPLSPHRTTGMARRCYRRPLVGDTEYSLLFGENALANYVELRQNTTTSAMDVRASSAMALLRVYVLGGWKC